MGREGNKPSFRYTWARLPSPQTSSLQAHEDGANQLAKRGWVHWLKPMVEAVGEIVRIECTPWQTYTICSLIVIQQPLNLRCKFVKNGNYDT
ncbi:unnamed protein product [Protopolystoma xenopodis]|uniref:Uncharacterized protein n=1 Tax=Protopolystoma xenopodis TaxID=117903 RepID=A0A448XCB3_9PLAT|nr:unnamed protein product [Protopolystoma xenopodis]